MVNLAKTIEGNSKDFELLEYNQTDYNERSMHAEFTYDIVFKTKGGETPFICDITFDFNIEGEQWSDEGWGGAWFEEQDEQYEEGVKVYEAKVVTTTKYIKKIKQ